MVRPDDRLQTLASFDWQWANLPSGDFMPGDPWFDANASRVLAEELCAIDPSWFRGKRVLDAGCGQGRWTAALLALGAHVTAVDYSQAGLDRTRDLCRTAALLDTLRVDLLDLPASLAAQKFDLVFSFGVLHHTGDTARALDNIARLVADDGALFLYLYGADSWSVEHRREVEAVREQLRPLAFDAKVKRLRERFPQEDSHQLFDLLSPVINDRVTFADVSSALQLHGFDRVESTVASTEVYVRATRAGFPASALREPVGEASSFQTAVGERESLRRAASFEDTLRSALEPVSRRPMPSLLGGCLTTLIPSGATVLDLSLPPDRLPSEALDRTAIRAWQGPSPVTPRLDVGASADAVVFLGCGLGACREPAAMLSSSWARVREGGVIAVELPERFSHARRSLVDKLVDYRAAVPAKLARLLTRRPGWCSGEGLFALGGNVLLNPLTPSDAAAQLRALGAVAVSIVSIGPERTLVTARAPIRHAEG